MEMGEACYHRRNIMMRATKATIAVLDVIGDIDFTTAQEALAALREAAYKYRPGVLVVRINSSGGSIAAAQQICEAVDALRANGVLTISCCGDIAKSAALYLAASADVVMAQPGTITGNVGATMRHASFAELAKRLGIHDIVIASGTFKDPGRLAIAPEDHELEIMRDVVMAVHRQFMAWLADRRNLSYDQLNRLADGRLLTGEEARNLGLIDHLGGFWRALTIAADHMHVLNPRVVFLSTRQNSRASVLSWLLPLTLRKLLPSLMR